MAWTFQQLVDTLEANYAYADFRDNIANTYQATALERHGQGAYESALWYIIKSVGALLDGFDSVLSHGYWGDYNYIPSELFYRIGEPTAAEIDMSAILDAMYNAKPHQPILFVSYLEAYYASVWNATFDEITMAELVKRWAIWG